MIRLQVVYVVIIDLDDDVVILVAKSTLTSNQPCSPRPHLRQHQVYVHHEGSIDGSHIERSIHRLQFPWFG